MEVDSTETREVERLDSRRLEMDLRLWSLRVLERTPELTSMYSSSLPFYSLNLPSFPPARSKADIRPSAHGGQTKDGGQDDRKSPLPTPVHKLISRNEV
jgi:hypothetical protein